MRLLSLRKEKGKMEKEDWTPSPWAQLNPHCPPGALGWLQPQRSHLSGSHWPLQPVEYTLTLIHALYVASSERTLELPAFSGMAVPYSPRSHSSPLSSSLQPGGPTDGLPPWGRMLCPIQPPQRQALML